MRLAHFMKLCSPRILQTVIFLEAREHQVHTLKLLLLQLQPDHVRYLQTTIEFVGANVSIIVFVPEPHLALSSNH